MWGIWGIQPDGRAWRPIVSAFHDARAFHFMTQVSDSRIVVVDYYNLNNSGFGTLLTVPETPTAGQPPFSPHSGQQSGSAGNAVVWRLPVPDALHAARDERADAVHPSGGRGRADRAGGVRVGKLSHPSGAPGNDLLVAYSAGPVNHLDRPVQIPRIDSGIYLIDQMQVITNPNQLVLVKNSPNYNEAWPRALVPYAAVHGVAAPASRPWLPNDGSVDARLPAGTPHGLVGSSSVYKRESFPGYTRAGYESYFGLDASTRPRTGRARTGSRKAPMPGVTAMPTSGRYGWWRWSQTRTAPTAPTRVSTTVRTPTRGCAASLARSRCARSTDGQPVARS